MVFELEAGVLDDGSELEFDPKADPKADNLEGVVAGNGALAGANNNATEQDLVLMSVEAYLHGLIAGTKNLSLHEVIECRKIDDAKLEVIVKSIAPYVRFNRQFVIRFAEIPKEDYVKMVAFEDDNLRYLFEKSDLAELFNDQVNIKIPLPNGLKLLTNTDAIEHSNVARDLQKLSKYGFSLDRIYSVGLFLEGDSYQRILRANNVGIEAKNVRSPALLPGFSIFSYENTNFIEVIKANAGLTQVVSTEMLKNYVQSSGEIKIHNVVNGLGEVLVELNKHIEQNDMDSARVLLYNRMKQYHPNLIA
jgi:hypothetical protein